MSHASAETVDLVPARADALAPELIGSLLHATDPHIFGWLHGRDDALSARHLGHQWTLPAGVFSHVHAIAAEHEGRMVGLELGFDRATQEAHTGPFVAAARAFLDDAQFGRFAGFFEHGSYLLPTVPEDAYYLQNLAALPEARGRGVGERLLADCFERARGAGLARVQLDVYDGNPAVRLYERVGMRTIVETRVPPLEAEGVGLHLRMELKL